jgi:ubiquinone/menaquinone biosynthesis C-methylase UbiE
VVSVLTLCTIPAVDRALAEIRRVLRPGGAFHFMEHGLSPQETVARWQHRLTPIQRRVFGGKARRTRTRRRARHAGAVLQATETGSG